MNAVLHLPDLIEIIGFDSHGWKLVYKPLLIMQAEPHRGVDRIKEEIQLTIVEATVLQEVIAFLSAFDYLDMLGIYIEAI